jgi:DNA polymerase-4
VPPGTEAAFLAPLPASALWGVGPKTEEKLAGLGMHTIGDIARWPEEDLRRRFGLRGELLSRHARGLDARERTTEREAKSVSKETTFPRDVADGEALREQVRAVYRQLANEGVCAATVRLKVRWSDFVTVTRQLSVASPTGDEAVLWPLALRLLDQVWFSGRPVRLLGFGVSGLEVPAQLCLWDTHPAEEAEKEQRVQKALAAVAAHLGPDAVRRVSQMPPLVLKE